MKPKIMFTKKIIIDRDEIIPPYDFAYQLENYVIYPETREGNSLVEIVKLENGEIVKVEIRSQGTIEEPALELTIKSVTELSERRILEIKEKISWYLGLKEDLKPFYKMVENDRVMQAAISMHYGAKDKASFSIFKAVIDCICAQNVIFKRLYSMMQNLCERFGDELELEGKTYHAFPTPNQLANASLTEIRDCKVGYRDKFIKETAEAVDSGEVDLERIKELPIEEAGKELMKLPGVGAYTANLSLILALRRCDILHLDLFVRESLWQFYFDGQQVSDEKLQKFAAEHWPGYQAWAAGLLTTNTEVWAKKLGKEFRLKSGAKK